MKTINYEEISLRVKQDILVCTTDIWEDSHIRCRMFNSIHGLYPLDASKHFLEVWQPNFIPGIAKISPGKQNCKCLRTKEEERHQETVFCLWAQVSSERHPWLCRGNLNVVTNSYCMESHQVNNTNRFGCVNLDNRHLRMAIMIVTLCCPFLDFPRSIMGGSITLSKLLC